MMAMERRNTVRMRVLKGGKLSFDRVGSTIDCTVRNLSNRGACLELGTIMCVPEEFDLSFDSFRSIRHCRVRWRTGKKLGVAFTG
jgi:PilZ domain